MKLNSAERFSFSCFSCIFEGYLFSSYIYNYLIIN